MSLWAAVAAALGMFFVTWKSRRQYSMLSALETPAAALQAEAAAVTVVIPARGEASNIGRCVASLLPFAAEVVVVDDGSTDGTAAAAEAAGARVIPAPPLAKGLKGKPNACLAGAQLASARWILFADADTWYRQAFLPAIVAHAETHKLDLAMAFLGQRPGTLWEHMLAPYAFGMYFTGTDVESAFVWKSRKMLACGECVLVRADAYEFTGGHRAFLRETLDDLELARLAKRHRLRFEAVRAEALGRVRPYGSLGEIWTGFRRHAAQYLNWKVLACAAWMALYVPVLVWLMLDGRAVATCAFAAVPMLASLAWYRNALAALLAPFAIYFFALLAAQALLARYFGVESLWKGRKVH